MKLFITRDQSEDGIFLGKLTLWACFPVADEESGCYSGNGKSMELDSDLFPEITHEKGKVAMDLVHSWQKTNWEMLELRLNCEEVLNFEAKEKKSTAEKALNGWSMDVEDPLPCDGKKFEDTLDRIATLLLKREDATSDDVVDKFIAKKSVEDGEDNEKLLKCEKISQEELPRLISGAPILIGSACRLASFISLKDDQFLASVVGHEEPVLSPTAYWISGVYKDVYLNPETFKDTETGLEWLISDDKRMSWEEAVTYADSLDKGWRLPTVKELSTLLDYSKSDPSCSKPLHMTSNCYWTGTTHEADDTYAWFVHFYDGSVSHYPKAIKYPTRLVRPLKEKKDE